MAPRPKLKYSSKCEEKDILQQTFDKLGYDEEVFLVCKFIGNDDDDNNFEFSGDSDDNDNGEMNNMKNVTSFMKIQSSCQRHKSSKIWTLLWVGITMPHCHPKRIVDSSAAMPRKLLISPGILLALTIFTKGQLKTKLAK